MPTHAVGNQQGAARDAALHEVATACEEIGARVLHGGSLRRVRACAPRADLDGALLPQVRTQHAPSRSSNTPNRRSNAGPRPVTAPGRSQHPAPRV